MGRWLRLWIPALLAAGGVGRGARVLDVATGTGEAALAVTTAHPRSQVVGADISVPMLRAARKKTEGQPIALAAMDGQALACRDGAFDAVLCVLGVMFFPDPLRGLREFRRVLGPGGRVALSVWSTAERSPFPGIASTSVARAPRRLVFDGFEDFWRPIEAGGSRAAQAYLRLDEPTRRTIRDETRGRMERFERDGRLVIDTEALIAVGQRG